MGWRDRVAARVRQIDMNDTFAYNIAKTVTIRDYKLGLMHLVLMGGFVIWFVINTFVSTAYAHRIAPVGNIRMTIQAPMAGSNAALCQYDSLKHLGCRNALPRLSSLKYCEQSTLAYDPLPKHQCLTMDGRDAMRAMDGGIMLSTRIRTWYQEPQECAIEGDDECDKLFHTYRNTTHYVAGVEDFILTIDHTVMWEDDDESHYKEQKHMVIGSLEVLTNDALCQEHERAYVDEVDGTERATEAPCYIRALKSYKGRDTFRVGTLLAATDTDLDSAPEGTTDSNRERGTAFILGIRYSNNKDRFFASDDVFYTYSPHVLTAKTKFDEVVYDHADITNVSARSSRTIYTRNGIKVTALPAGEIQVFAFEALLVHLATFGVGTAFASMVVQWCMSNLFKLKHVYGNAINEDTYDIPAIREKLRQKKADMKRLGMERGERKKRMTELMTAYDPIEKRAVSIDVAAVEVLGRGRPELVSDDLDQPGLSTTAIPET